MVGMGGDGWGYSGDGSQGMKGAILTLHTVQIKDGSDVLHGIYCIGGMESRDSQVGVCVSGMQRNATWYEMNGICGEYLLSGRKVDSK